MKGGNAEYRGEEVNDRRIRFCVHRTKSPSRLGTGPLQIILIIMVRATQPSFKIRRKIIIHKFTQKSRPLPHDVQEQTITVLCSGQSPISARQMERLVSAWVYPFPPEPRRRSETPIRIQFLTATPGGFSKRRCPRKSTFPTF